MNMQERITQMLGAKDLQIASMGEALEQAQERIKALEQELTAAKAEQGNTKEASDAAGKHRGHAGNGDGRPIDG